MLRRNTFTLPSHASWMSKQWAIDIVLRHQFHDNSNKPPKGATPLVVLCMAFSNAQALSHQKHSMQLYVVIARHQLWQNSMFHTKQHGLWRFILWKRFVNLSKLTRSCMKLITMLNRKHKNCTFLYITLTIRYNNENRLYYYYLFDLWWPVTILMRPPYSWPRSFSIDCWYRQ